MVLDKFDPPIFLTRPLTPPLAEMNALIAEIFASHKLTNMGEKHNRLESTLAKYLKISNVSLFNNGTVALLSALRALELPVDSEVITTPFTFAATPHCIAYNGLKPIFCDIEPNTMCIDADKIEQLITPNTSAILGVHVYGFPCDVHKISAIAAKHNLKVIYDAAHAFGTELDGKSISAYGDISMFSFHATKLFHTVEGGCLSYNNSALRQKIADQRNFGIHSEDLVAGIGINGKLNEIQAAVGLLVLDMVSAEKQKRKKLKEFYNEKLSDTQGLKIPVPAVDATDSHQYYPIIIEDDFPISRDALYDRFRKLNIMVRKYFYPACSDYGCYSDLPSARQERLPVVNDMKNRVLCLPYYGDLSHDIAGIICDFIRSF